MVYDLVSLRVGSQRLRVYRAGIIQQPDLVFSANRDPLNIFIRGWNFDGAGT